MEFDYHTARKKMVEEQLVPRGIHDKRILDVMSRVPRHLFVKENLRGEAYDDHPLSIGDEQTISQPYIVALMTQELELAGTEKTLEIGTGSAYQTAILAEMSDRVYTIERIEPLLTTARWILEDLGYTNIFFRHSDGTGGWKEQAPFDAIMVTAGAPRVPQPLLDQLAEGGRMIIPVGDRFSQDLIRVRNKRGRFHRGNLGGCRFVGLVGSWGWRD